MKDEKTFLKDWMWKWILGVVVSLIVLPLLGVAMEFNDYWKGIVVSIFLVALVIRWAINYWYNNFEEHGIKNEKRKNPYRKMFFGSVNIISLLLLLIGLLGAFFLIFSSDGKNHAFEALGLVITIIWAVIFLRYFIWAIYHYNINFGLTDNDWHKILKAREDRALGLDVSDDQVKGPKYNPYRSQTFGLPPGTVRGMIAFTLLFGAISMLVVSMGMNGNIDQNSFFWDHFEFYKTAFLMMIAFYFGDRSLKYLQKRWPSVQQAKLKQAQLKGNGEPNDEIAEDDAEFASENVSTDDHTSSIAKFSPTSLKRVLAASEGESESEESVDDNQLEQEYVQIKDSETVKTLTDDSVASVARDNDIEPAVLKSIIKIESAGSGFLSDGRPKILFEGHKFWYWLKQRKKKPENYVSGNENILYESWTRKYYLGGTREYERFQKAYNIDPVAAIYATSWGLFQILGENFNPTWGYCKSRMDDATPIPEGFLGHHYESIDKNPKDFVEKQGITEVNHLLDFLAFVKNKKVKYTSSDGKNKFNGKLIEAIDNAHNSNKKFNWEAFAYGYNGSGFKKNNYDTKLEKTYEMYSNA